MAKPNPTKLTVTSRQARSVAVLLAAVASLVACAPPRRSAKPQM